MIHFITIVLDGMPYIKWHHEVFNTLPFKWQWLITEGAAMNNHCTSWAKRQPGRLSRDGTSAYLLGLAAKNKSVSVFQRPLWNGKIEMVNAHSKKLITPGIVMEIDADEIWSADQLRIINSTFNAYPNLMGMRFYCRYFVGPDIITVGENCYGNNPGEWMRAWRTDGMMRFSRHEPPVFNGNRGWIMPREETRLLGLVFDHFAYASESQVAYKEQFYGYKGAVEQWRRLQANTEWPVRLKDFLPWVDDRVQAIRIQNAPTYFAKENCR